VGLKSGSQEAWDNRTLDTTYRPHVSDIYETDPNTGASWTADAIDNLHFGVKIP